MTTDENTTDEIPDALPTPQLSLLACIKFRKLGLAGTVVKAVDLNDYMARTAAPGQKLGYRINSRNWSNSKLLQFLLLSHGMRRVSDDGDAGWNIWWCAGQVDPFALKGMQRWQRINKIPKASCLTLKPNLARSVGAMQQKFGEQHFNFIPLTFILPLQRAELLRCMETESDQKWILKPDGNYCGTGVYILRRGDAPPSALKCVVCRYIERPFLVNGLKSDIRLYVLVKSVQPLCVYLYEDGLVRFATEEYQHSNDPEVVANPYMHLTNYSLNRHSHKFVQNNNTEEACGNKWTVKAFKRFLVDSGIATNEGARNAWNSIEDICLKTIISALPQLSTAMAQFANFSENCFQLFGIDLMLDEKLRPWLLEVNLDPSLDCSSELDYDIKSCMLQELLNIVQVPLVDPKQGRQLEQQEALEDCPYEGNEAIEVRQQVGDWKCLYPASNAKNYSQFLDQL